MGVLARPAVRRPGTDARLSIPVYTFFRNSAANGGNVSRSE
jgi:hypothetical protein